MNRTAQTFDRMATRDEWLGFGYLGGRQNALSSTDPEAPAQPALVAAIDALVLEATADWTEAELFAWANSRSGRYFADVVFGGADDADQAPARFAEARRFSLLHKIAR